MWKTNFPGATGHRVNLTSAYTGSTHQEQYKRPTKEHKYPKNDVNLFSKYRVNLDHFVLKASTRTNLEAQIFSPFLGEGASWAGVSALDRASKHIIILSKADSCYFRSIELFFFWFVNNYFRVEKTTHKRALNVH